MIVKDLLDQADHLAKRSPKKPRQADLKRAISSTYYAVFHALCGMNSDALIGTGSARSDKAWAQVYRAVDHGQAKNRCKLAQDKDFPDPIKNFANAFTNLQERRHRADYDPNVSEKRSEVLNLVSIARNAVSGLAAVPVRERRAFAAFILLPMR